MRTPRSLQLVVGAATVMAGCAVGSSAAHSAPTAPPASPSAASSVVSAVATVAPQATGHLPVPAHVVVVVEENHAQSQIIGSSAAPYINSLARTGASFTNAHAVTHPSEPNYLALFSGSTQGVTTDACPQTFGGSDLGAQLRSAHLSFAGYSESMPSQGYTGCTSGTYARKHNPWSDFTNLPASVNKSFAQFPSSYSALPTVSFVVPNLNDDMHNGTVPAGDAWLKAHLSGYVTWAKTHNSILILTWDEDDDTVANHIPTIIVGAHVKTGSYGERINHYNVLRTIEDMYHLGHIGNAATVSTITDIWS